MRARDSALRYLWPEEPEETVNFVNTFNLPPSMGYGWRWPRNTPTVRFEGHQHSTYTCEKVSPVTPKNEISTIFYTQEECNEQLVMHTTPLKKRHYSYSPEFERCLPREMSVLGAVGVFFEPPLSLAECEKKALEAGVPFKTRYPCFRFVFSAHQGKCVRRQLRLEEETSLLTVLETVFCGIVTASPKRRASRKMQSKVQLSAELLMKICYCEPETQEAFCRDPRNVAGGVLYKTLPVLWPRTHTTSEPVTEMGDCRERLAQYCSM